MVSFKAVFGNKQGKSVQKELNDEQSSILIGKKIGDKIVGDEIGLKGYEFEITGGSDNSGTPMRRDAEGIGKRKILCVEGTGVTKIDVGQRQRKTVSGNTISDLITQVNMKILKEGEAPLVEPKKEEGNNA